MSDARASSLSTFGWDAADDIVWRRLVAAAVDLVPFLALCCVPPVFILAWSAYLVVGEGVWGTTLGKRLLRLKVVNRQGHPPGLAVAIFRHLLRSIALVAVTRPNSIVPFILLKHQQTSENGQRIGDRLTRTFVVNRDDERAPMGPQSLVLTWT